MFLLEGAKSQCGSVIYGVWHVCCEVWCKPVGCIFFGVVHLYLRHCLLWCWYREICFCQDVILIVGCVFPPAMDIAVVVIVSFGFLLLGVR